MIRLTTPNDTTPSIALAEASGLFEPSQTEELAQMLDRHFNGETENQDLWFTDDDRGVVGVAYVAPERMTEGTWNLCFYFQMANDDRGRAYFRPLRQFVYAISIYASRQRSRLGLTR